MSYYTAFELRSELEDEFVNEDAEVIIVDMHGVYMQPAHIFIHHGIPVLIVEMVGSYEYDAALREDVSQALRTLREQSKQQRLL
jgi:hypothetical protein